MNSDVQAYHDNLEEGRKLICDKLFKAINDHLKSSENKLWHGSPVWFIDGNPIVGYSSLKNGVQLLFWSGQSFDEPGLNPEGSFKAAEARYVTVDQIDEYVLIRWLQKAAMIQWDYKNIVKRKGQLERLKQT